MTKIEEDIIEIEKILLPEGCSFDDERRDFIMENSKSLDLVACAGSGKTTALLAKLLLLERDLKKDKGICVLTHTNVAIDEVKAKISLDSVLLNNPNHFSTIQQFVDKFLTIPAYRHLTGKRLVQIDTDQTNKRFVNNFFNLSAEHQSAFFKYQKLGKTTELKIELLKSGVEYVMGIGEYHYQFRNIHTKKVIPIKSGDTFTAIKKAKDPVFKDGYITYEEAYYLANWYLDKYPFIRKCISERFSHVFLDEMQDTSDLQEKLLKKLFDGSDVVVQRIGDPNQTIYDGPDNTDVEWQPSGLTKSIKGSLRLSPSIVTAIKNVRWDCTEEIYGNESLPLIKPYILTFKEGEESKVIEKFKYILKGHYKDLNYKSGDSIKIIGWTGKEKDGLCIPKYCPSFTNLSSKKYLSNFESYKIQYEEYHRKDNTLRSITSTFYTICTQLLFELNIKNNGKYFAQKDVTQFLENDLEIKETIFKLTFAIAHSSEGWDKVKPFLADVFISKFSDENTEINIEKLEHFLNGTSETPVVADNRQDEYIDVEEFQTRIPITVSTIHSVKGETHKATLYLETKYYKHDIERLLKSLCNKLDKLEDLDKKRKMMGYVAMSRASHLLCLAVRDSAVDVEMEAILTELGWQVQRVPEA